MTAATPEAGKPSRLKRVVQRTLGVIAVLVLLVALGPRNEFGPETPSQRASPPTELTALDAWLARSEATFPDIRPNNAKGITWQGPEPRKTAWSVVYLHGFSASRLETAPLAAEVAAALGANLFETRLAGHGRGEQAMGEASVQDWLADTVEAIRIGRMLGERVLVIACSTGATLATWHAVHEDAADLAFAFVSPNYGPRNKRSELINGPWGRQIALQLEGEMRGRAPQDSRELAAWTHRYPTRALFPMMALVKAVRDSDLARFKAPVLTMFSDADQTVDPAETRAVVARMGTAEKTLVNVDFSQAAGQHVLTGAIKDPASVPRFSATIVAWARNLPQPGAPR